MAALLHSFFTGNAADKDIDMTAWDFTSLQTGEIVEATDTSCTIRAGDETYVLTGEDFVYEATVTGLKLDGGTITRIEYTSDPAASTNHYDYSISRFEMDVDVFNEFVAGNDVKGFQKAVFSEDDLMWGGTGSDTLTGLSGHDLMIGGTGDDALYGGKDADLLAGGAGRDWLAGGQGTDAFAYRFAFHSGGGVYDTVDKFNTRADLFVVPDEVEAIDAAVEAGYAESANVDPELEGALDADHLGAHHAAVASVWVPLGPMFPAFRLEVFLVVDVNGDAGYQAGEDLAIRLDDARHVDELSVDNFIALSG
jgi:hypothetical protein